jgi:DNA mismatch repair protein MutS
MSDTLTPMMRQYRQVKNDLPDGVILFFRLGDFYEMFFEDARNAAPILDITLTRRQGVPMCGVPFHSVDGYIARLIRAGHKVAICEQVEDPRAAKGIIKREVSRIVTPGTVTEDGILESRRHNFLAGICRAPDGFGLAFLDVSTGYFCGEQVPDIGALIDELKRFAPTECVVPAGQADEAALHDALKGAAAVPLTRAEDWTFHLDTAYELMTRHFAVASLDGFGCENRPAIVCAAGGVLHYVRESLMRKVSHVGTFRVMTPADFMMLDEATVANLDMVPARGKPDAACLLSVLDVTRTPMGARKLRDWLLRPLGRLDAIEERQEAVAAFCAKRSLLGDFREALAGVRDLERLIARIACGTGNARDVVGLGRSLECLPAIQILLSEITPGLMHDLCEQIAPLPDVVELILRALVDEPPVSTKEGGLMRDGYHAELDALRHAGSEGRQWLAEYQAREITRTGIKTLKVRFNRVFGYYIEISKGQSDHAPADYMRKQTLVNAERFITPELKEYENRILGAKDRAIALEQELFEEVRSTVAGQTASIQRSADALARLDVLAAFAERALTMRYVRPKMIEGETVSIRNGRHPVIEQLAEAERFVPNDALLDCVNNQLMIITGPNMAGKSTYIRQVALIVVMAHTGSFVPATEAEMGLVDRVFTRVGASDDMARGRSTFMVEMQETANILNNATARSLIVLDEIGRGTSTFDGISIAWAVAEFLHNTPHSKAKTLFATHYHELTDLALTMPGIKNYSVLVREQNDRIAFLRKIVPGGADKSYGIQVARLAGMPPEVIDRAKEILQNLEEGEFSDLGQPKIARHRPRKNRDNNSEQLSLFVNPD